MELKNILYIVLICTILNLIISVCANEANDDRDGVHNNNYLSNKIATVISSVTSDRKKRQENEADNQIDLTMMMMSPKTLRVDNNNISEYTPWDNPSTDLDTWEAPSNIIKEYPYYISGYDSESRPIWILQLGRWNVRKIVEEGGESLKTFNKYVEQAAYRTIRAIRDRSTPEVPVTDSILICDFDEFNLFQLAHVSTVSYLLNSARRYRSVTSKDLHAALVVNVNSIAVTLLNLLRTVYTDIFERIEIFGTNRARWIPHVLKFCPKDQIPEYYGGKKDWKPAKIYG